jgi:hypothetical protein
MTITDAVALFNEATDGAELLEVLEMVAGEQQPADSAE